MLTALIRGSLPHDQSNGAATEVFDRLTLEAATGKSKSVRVE